MENKKLSSLEFYRKNLHAMVSGNSTEFKTEVEIFEKAKAMHKEEIEDAWDKGDYCIDLPDGTWEQKYKSAEQYYNETFNNNE